MSKIQGRIKALKTASGLAEINPRRVDKGMPILEHVIVMKKGSIDNLEHRRDRMRWLIGNFGCRGERWDFIIRPEGGSTYLFKERDDAILFKMIWAGG